MNSIELGNMTGEQWSAALHKHEAFLLNKDGGEGGRLKVYGPGGLPAMRGRAVNSMIGVTFDADETYVNCGLVGSNLRHMRCKGKFDTCNFWAALLQDCTFRHSYLLNCTFDNAAMQGCKFDNVTFSNNGRASSFKGASFTGCEFKHCTLSGCDLSYADLTSATFKSCGLDGADFTNTKLHSWLVYADRNDFGNALLDKLGKKPRHTTIANLVHDVLDVVKPGASGFLIDQYGDRSTAAALVFAAHFPVKLPLFNYTDYQVNVNAISRAIQDSNH